MVRTELVRYIAFPLSVFFMILKPFTYFFMKNAWQGAQTTLYTVMEEESKLVKGGYYSDCREMKSTDLTCSL